MARECEEMLLRAEQVRALIIVDGKAECEASQDCELMIAQAGQTCTVHTPLIAVPENGSSHLLPGLNVELFLGA